MFARYPAHVLCKLIAGQLVQDRLEALPGAWRSIGQSVQAAPPSPELRARAFEAAIAGRDDAAELRAAVFACDPQTELPPNPPNPDATSDEPEVEELAPPLPECARVDPQLGAQACPWLDDYIAFSRMWAPRAYDGFHEAVGLFVLSTVAARRVALDLGPQRYTNLFIALTARSSIYTKTTAARIGLKLIRAAGLKPLLAANNATPQKLIADMEPSVPRNWARLDENTRESVLLQMAFAGQRGWFYEEFGQQLRAMMQDNNIMGGFRGLMRQLDDNEEDYSNATISRGTDFVDRPYLAFLANMTPDDLRPYARRGSLLWGNGFLARFAFVTPHEYRLNPARFPLNHCDVPASLLTPLVRWHQKLGIPQVVIDELKDKKGEGSGEYTVRVFPGRAQTLEIDLPTYDAYYSYNDSLLKVNDEKKDYDLAGNYARFGEKALRIAMLLASISGQEQINISHWARAQAITEQWRQGLHNLRLQVSEPSPSDERQQEERIMTYLLRFRDTRPEFTIADVVRGVRGVSRNDASRLLDGLVASGELTLVAQTQKGTRRYALPPAS